MRHPNYVEIKNRIDEMTLMQDHATNARLMFETLTFEN